jgi:hypothetical protein
MTSLSQSIKVTTAQKLSFGAIRQRKEAARNGGAAGRGQPA